MTASKAILANVGIFEADVSGLRRSLASLSLNFPSVANSVSKVSQDLNPAQVATFGSTGQPRMITMLRCSAPVLVSYQLLPVSGVSSRAIAVTVVTLVTAFLLVDDKVGALTVTNQDTVNPVSITLIQG